MNAVSGGLRPRHAGPPPQIDDAPGTIRFRRRKRRLFAVETAAPPAIPHGEGLGFDRDPEVTLPDGPRCGECKEKIYYERGVWWHADLATDYDHQASPFICHLTGERYHGRITE